MKKTLMRKYARLIAVSGVNVQPGQPCTINACVDQYACACFFRAHPPSPIKTANPSET